MKQKFLYAFLFFIFLNLNNKIVFAQTNAPNNLDISQVVMPVDVYIGDRAQILFSFRTGIDLSSDENEKTEILLDVKKLPFNSISEKCSIVDAALLSNKNEYTLRFTIIPWQTGDINFPPFNLLSVLDLTQKNSESYIIQLLPVNVKSIVEKTKATKLRPPVPPIMIPGTTYIILLVIVLALVILILFFRFVLRYKKILAKWKNYQLLKAYKKNAALILKKIKKLKKDTKLTDVEFSSELQNITRSYLEYRFACPFSAISTSCIVPTFEKMLGDRKSVV